MDCITNVSIPIPLVEECAGNYISTNCIVIPQANITLDLPVNSSQTEVNDAITTALIYKEQQITELQANIDTRLTVIESIPSGDSRPYKVYTALLTQTGTDAPVATVLENTIGGTFTWTYQTVGIYKLTMSVTRDMEKTLVFITPFKTVVGYGIAYGIQQVDFESFYVSSGLSAGAYYDGEMVAASMEIRIYN